MARHVFLTGPPGVGKTTLIQKASEALKASGVPVDGFYTEEVRQGGRRTGFDVVTLSGSRGPLSRVGSEPPPGQRECRVGQYVVDVASLERLVLPVLRGAGGSGPGWRVCVIDEIGKMELFSQPFIQAVRQTLSSPGTVVLGTIPIPKGKPLALVEEIRKRQDVKVFSVSRPAPPLPPPPVHTGLPVQCGLVETRMGVPSRCPAAPSSLNARGRAQTRVQSRAAGRCPSKGRLGLGRAGCCRTGEDRGPEAEPRAGGPRGPRCGLSSPWAERTRSRASLLPRGSLARAARQLCAVPCILPQHQALSSWGLHRASSAGGATRPPSSAEAAIAEGRGEAGRPAWRGRECGGAPSSVASSGPRPPGQSTSCAHEKFCGSGGSTEWAERRK